MAEKSTFANLIKDLDPFDRKVLFALERLKTKKGTMTVKTSRFQLLSLLRLEYNEKNVDLLEKTLTRLSQETLYAQDSASGFAVAAKSIVKVHAETDSEQIVIVLGKLFSACP